MDYDRSPDTDRASAIDPKSAAYGQYPQYQGPQGDLRRVYNLVRPVRTIKK